MTDSTPETELPKTFDPARIEAKWYEHWETNGLFRPLRPDAEPFTIVNPPPNVTGSLHIGHALDNTLQDVVIRYERLRGKDALWVVGTDHAGIATQMVVERQLEERQDKRTNYTREQFIDKVWEWKAESGGTITRQLRRLGCSMDWSREQFTMDPHFTKAVVKVFVDLYNQGLIYRDKRLVNWDPKLKTAISDLEVETREVKGSFWRFRYPLTDGGGHIEVATTRPETMLADMAVAVNPDDGRYLPLVMKGLTIRLPLTGREIPLIADEHADPELGSGAVKITPGHDFNDFEVGKRAGIKPTEMLNMFDAEARVVQTADGLVPDEFVGLDRFAARKLVVQRMKELGLLIPHVDKDEVEHDAEPRVIQTPFGDRGGVEIEPWLTDQWYVNAAELAKAPIEAVKSGAVEIVPKSWEKTFFNWMENIQPWCVSRQLWWGHRIPAWFDQDGAVYVAETEEAAQTLAGDKILRRDEDVLDTWFSSALWPFATLGWPEEDSPRNGEDLLARHYPNSLLVSGFDILFFWDARMMMMGQAMTGQNPWPRLYLHGLVRAADGSKMSKSKGNTVDPLILMDKYGADALRFFMAAMESQGRDIKMDERRVEGYRNFATKLWNAARFCQSNGIGASDQHAAPPATIGLTRWILGELAETIAAVDSAMAELRFDQAAGVLYHFVWDRFCDWYLELLKPEFSVASTEIAAELRAVSGWVLDQILILLHPFMPFITEELWNALGTRQHELIIASWPKPSQCQSTAAAEEIGRLISLITELRSLRAEYSIPPKKVELYLTDGDDLDRLIFSDFAEHVVRIGGAAALHIADQGALPTGQLAQIGTGSMSVVIPLEGVIDIAAEKARLAKALEASTKEAKSLEGRLSNAAFVEKAKPEAVEKARSDHAMHAAEAERLAAALARLG